MLNNRTLKGGMKLKETKIVDMELIKKIVYGKTWSIRQFCLKANISVDTFYALQAKRRNASTRTIYKMANALGVEPNTILKQ